VQAIAAAAAIDATRIAYGRDIPWQRGLPYGFNFVFPLLILNAIGEPVPTNETTALCDAIVAAIITRGGDPNSDVYRITAYFAARTSPSPIFLVEVAVIEVNYLWVAFIAFGVACVALTAFLVLRLSGDDTPYTKIDDDDVELVHTIPGDTFEDNEAVRRMLEEKGAQNQIRSLRDDARKGISLVGVEPRLRDIALRGRENIHSAPFSSCLEEVLLHDHMFQLPPKDAPLATSMRKGLSFRKTQQEGTQLPRKEASPSPGPHDTNLQPSS
jgi:hypothetical protein